MGDNLDMPKNRDSKTIVADNLKKLMEYNQHSQGYLHRKTGLSQSTIGRVTKGVVSSTIDTVEDIAAVYGLQAWQMFVDDLDISNPPVLQMSKEERDFYENIKKAAQSIVERTAD